MVLVHQTTGNFSSLLLTWGMLSHCCASTCFLHFLGHTLVNLQCRQIHQECNFKNITMQFLPITLTIHVWYRHRCRCCCIWRTLGGEGQCWTHNFILFFINLQWMHMSWPQYATLQEQFSSSNDVNKTKLICSSNACFLI